MQTTSLAYRRAHRMLMSVASGAKLACIVLTVICISGVSHAQSGASPHGDQANANANSLPIANPAFSGVIGTTYKDSKSDFPQPVTPPKGAPNVLIILIDDLGFAGTSPFGGLVPTPNFDRLAQRGLRYNEVHNTALCSPSRAALLSGRNHHQVGMGGITEGATGFPGYNSI